VDPTHDLGVQFAPLSVIKVRTAWGCGILVATGKFLPKMLIKPRNVPPLAQFCIPIHPIGVEAVEQEVDALGHMAMPTLTGKSPLKSTAVEGLKAECRIEVSDVAIAKNAPFVDLTGVLPKKDDPTIARKGLVKDQAFASSKVV
jgi:hypothetical protein